MTLPGFRSLTGSFRPSKSTRRNDRTRRRSLFFGQSEFFQQLETRELLTSANITNSTLNLVLDQANQKLTISAQQGAVYQFVLSGGANNTWSGSGTGLSISNGTLTSTNLTAYNTVKIWESSGVGGVSVYFGSGNSTNYNNNFNITLGDTACSTGAVVIDTNVTANFTGSSALAITADGPVKLNSGANLTLANGNIDITVNTPSGGAFADSGLTVSNGTLQTTGTGQTTITARGGNGACSTFKNKGVAVIAGGKILGGSTGTLSITGYGYNNLSTTSSKIQGQGVLVSSNLSTEGTSTISSNGANVVVRGYGANDTNSNLAASSANAITNAGVVVGCTTFSTNANTTGLITSGGNGSVTIIGTGGSLADQPVVDTGSGSNYAKSVGVLVSGQNAAIKSGGAGLVNVTGYGGGATTNTVCGTGVAVYAGTITSGTDGSVTVSGTGCTTANTQSQTGVYLFDAACISSGAGNGSTSVTGQGGGCGSSSNYSQGIYLQTGGTITALGSGNVTVTGSGGQGQCTFNKGVYLAGNGNSQPLISSNGGEVLVTGTGGTGGGGASTYCTGVEVNVNSMITAGGTGNVTVRGYGGNNDGTQGNFNYGVSVTSSGNGQKLGKITSSGGNVTVAGTGGGGNANSANASASANNVGVFADQGGYITAGGNGTVTVIGQGGGRSPGATGSNNHGVCISGANTTSANTAAFSYISSNGGAVSVTGTGGGGADGTAGTSGNNYGVFVEKGGTITTGGDASLTVNGTGGGYGNGSTANNFGVSANGTQQVTSNSTYVRSTITTGGNGTLTINGTGGGAGGSGAANYGIFVNSGALITAGGANANVNLTGRGGNSTVQQNYGVNITGGNATVGNSTITSNGGNVTVLGYGPQTSGTGNNQHGVVMGANSVLSSGGNGSVNVTGTAGTGDSTGSSGNGHVGVQVSGNATLTSGGTGAVQVTGFGGGSGTRTNNYGVQVLSAGVIGGGNGANVTVRGTGGNANGTGGSNHGVYVTGANSKITSTNGTLQVTGTGGATNTTTSGSSSNYGVDVESAAKIAATGNGTVTVSGIGGGLGTGVNSNNHGVITTLLASGASPMITSEGGLVLVEGTGGGTGGTGTTNYGVAIIYGGQISNTGNAGNVTVRGTGGGNSANGTANNTGIYLEGCSTVSNYTLTANNGTISLTGIEGTGSNSTGLGANLSRAGVIGNATTPGNITITADSVAISTWSGSAVNAGSNLTIQPRTAGTAIDLGSSGGTANGPLAISSNELGTLSAGTIQLGNVSSGNVTISAAVTVPAGSNLTLASNGTGTALIPTACATGLSYTSGKSLNVSSVPAVSVSIGGTSVGLGYTQLKVVGDLSIANKTLNLSGAYTPTGGNVFTVVSATNLTGTFTGLANGSTTTFNGRTLIVNYTATSVTLTDPAPLITTQPTDSTVYAGSTASFTATATGSPTPGVQWQVNTGSGWNNIGSATSTTYSFTATAAENTYQYRAVFTNTYGTATTSSATLTVEYAPSVTTQPTNQIATVGQTATFTVAASGNPAPTVQWQSNNGGGWTDITGATGTSYTTDALAGTDSGTQYHAVFSNSVGSTTSDPATLTVGKITTTTTLGTSVSPVVLGDSVIFTATVTSGATGSVTFKDGSTTLGTVSLGGTTATYTTSGLSAGSHSITAVYSGDTTYDTSTSGVVAQVIAGAPLVTSNPSGSTVNGGSTASFTASAIGNPTPTVQWQVSSNGGTTWANISGATNATYSFTAVAGNEGNQYRAVFINSLGSAASTAATLHVNQAPVVNSNPLNVSANSGSMATFSAAATGSPVPTVQWQKNTGTGWNDIAGATSISYTTPSLTPGDTTSQYRAVFTNTFGNATTSAATLTIGVVANISSTSVGWGTQTASLADAGNGRLLPAGRTTDIPWLGINKLTITLDQAVASLTASNVTLKSAGGFSYSVSSVTGSGTTWTINLAGSGLANPDKVTVTVGSSSVASYSKRLDVLPGDVNDDGLVSSVDQLLVSRQLTVGYIAFYDVDGTGTLTSADVNLIKTRIGNRLPA